MKETLVFRTYGFDWFYDCLFRILEETTTGCCTHACLFESFVSIACSWPLPLKVVEALVSVEAFFHCGVCLGFLLSSLSFEFVLDGWLLHEVLDEKGVLEFYADAEGALDALPVV